MARRRRNMSDPRWLTYEKKVAELLQKLDSRSFVEHNGKQVGEISLTPRQLDVVATGTVVGQPIKIVGECKCYRTRPVTVGGIDEFIGKLLDVGADRGILFSYTGFSDGAFLRAAGARGPSVGLIALGEIEIENGAPLAHSASMAPDSSTKQIVITEDYRDFLEQGTFLYQEEF
ncbi:restriction endonuclease [Actinomadura sp. NTSP31]|uniref:restriction endonuclease n=1 Tax=Actinomadura sp. NTSP31 TaxID=1735447 RepID=UPI0035C099FA